MLTLQAKYILYKILVTDSLLGKVPFDRQYFNVKHKVIRK